MDSDPDPDIFVIDLQEAKKTNFFIKFICLLPYVLKASFFKDKKSKKSHKTVGIKVFLLLLLDERRIQIHTCDKWIRFREAQKHVDPIRIRNTGLDSLISYSTKHLALLAGGL